MNNEQFDNYRFGINTKVKLFLKGIEYGDFINITAVDFEKREVEINGCQLVYAGLIKEIKD